MASAKIHPAKERIDGTIVHTASSCHPDMVRVRPDRRDGRSAGRDTAQSKRDASTERRHLGEWPLRRWFGRGGDWFTYTGGANASGTFAGGNGVIGLPSGILLTSGNVTNVVGPNTSDQAGAGNAGAGNALLQTLIPNGQATEDASVLQLTIIPQGQTLQFKYVFGSEEYNEFSTSQFNDVFGFFVNGQNYALIPGTGTPVAINNINIGDPAGSACVNCAFFVNNDPFDGGLNSAPFNTQLDGFTTVLSFIAPVNPGVRTP